MLKTNTNSQSSKTPTLAVTYRSGLKNQFGTCPKTCSLCPLSSKKEDTIDMDYLKVLVNTVPKHGTSYTYTHFDLDKIEDKNLLNDIKYNTKKATINRSADTIQQAINYKNNNYDVVVVVPHTEQPKKHFTVNGTKFVRCIAEYNKKINCSNCDLCTKKQRDYVVVFYAHGNQKKKIGNEKGGCYGASGRTNLHWLATQKQQQNKKDFEVLKDFIKNLPHGKKLRHHVVGDIGLED